MDIGGAFYEDAIFTKLVALVIGGPVCLVGALLFFLGLRRPRAAEPAASPNGASDGVLQSEEPRRAAIGELNASRHRMRISSLVALMVLSPVLALADVQWHEFGTSTSDKYPIKYTNTIGHAIRLGNIAHGTGWYRSKSARRTGAVQKLRRFRMQEQGDEDYESRASKYD